MNIRLFLILDVLVLFVAYTVWVIASVGYVDFFRQALATPAGVQVLIDLVIALTIVLVWLRSDTKSTGIAFAPYLVLTLVLGSVGPLGYLLHKELRARRTVAGRVATA